MIALPTFRAVLYRAAGGAPAPDIEYVNFTSGNIGNTRSPATTGPTAQVNDILICAMSTDSAFTLGNTLPTGWNLIDFRSAGGDGSSAVFWKRVTTAGVDSSTWTNVFDTTESGVWSIVAYRNCVTTGCPVGNTNVGHLGTTQSTFQVSVQTTELNSLVVGVFGTDPTAGATFTWTSPSTERVDVINSDLGFITIGDRPAPTISSYQLAGTPSTSDTYTRHGFELLKTNPATVRYISHRRNSFSAIASPVITGPVAEVNDILLLAITTDDAHTLNSTYPTGWNLINTQTYTTEHTTSVFWKRVTTAGVDSFTWTNIFTTTELGVWAMSNYRGCITSGDPYGSIATGGFASTSTWSVPITSTTANSTCVAIFGSDPANASFFNWNSSQTACRVDYNNPAGLLGYTTQADRYAPTTGVYVLSGTVLNSAAAYTRLGVELLPPPPP